MSVMGTNHIVLIIDILIIVSSVVFYVKRR